MPKVTLAGARVSAGLSQEQLARKMGVTRVTVANWEKGKTKMKPATFYMLCHITGFDRNDIVLPVNFTSRKKGG